jgi:hypothetical protein
MKKLKVLWHNAADNKTTILLGLALPNGLISMSNAGLVRFENKSQQLVAVAAGYVELPDNASLTTTKIADKMNPGQFTTLNVWTW